MQSSKKLHAWNQEQIWFWEFLLPFGQFFVPTISLRMIKIHGTLISSVLYGLWNPHCHVTEKHGTKVFKNSIVRNMFGPKRGAVTKDCMMRFTMCPSGSRLLFGWSNKEWDGRGFRNLWGQERCVQSFGVESWGAKPSQSSNWGRRPARSVGRRPSVW